jgi:MFS family permease
MQNTSLEQPASPFTRQQRIILWLACAAIFFEAFDVSIVNLALPLIAAEIHIPVAHTQWIQTLYLLSFGGFLLPGGRLCDYAGSKRIYMIGMLIFGGSSALALLSNHFTPLLLARAGQGIGAALAMPAGISLLAKNFTEGHQRQTAFGIFGAFAAIGFAGGLALGGLIASAFDWHWIFGINVPVITGILITGYFFIPDEKTQRSIRLNLLSACWLTASLLLFCFGVHESTQLGWWLIPCIMVAIISGIFLTQYDRKQEQPFFGAGIYTSAAVFRALGASFILGASFLGFVFVCTLSLFQTMHWNIRQTGLLLFPYSIGSALVSKFLLPGLFRNLKVIQVGLLSMACLLGGVLFLTAGIYTGHIGYFLVALALVNSFCIAIGYPAFTILSLEGVPAARQGIAAGLQSAIYSIGTGIGLSVIGLCLQAFSHYPARIQLLSACSAITIFCLIAIGLLRGRRLSARRL